MAGGIKKAAAWLGLVEDDRYADYGEIDEQTTEVYSSDRDLEPSQITVLPDRRPTTAPEPAPVSPPHTPAPTDLSGIITVHPHSYNEARTIGEHFRDGVPVIMNLTGMDDSDAKRLVDFAAGLIFGLRGNIVRVTSKVFLLSPQNVVVTEQDKERIAAGGFFNQS